MPGQVGPEGGGGGGEAGGGIGGSGTLNRLAKFTSAGEIGNSRIADTGTAITINSGVDFALIGDTTGEGNSTTLRVDDANSLIRVDTGVFRGTADGTTNLGTSAVGFGQLFLDSTITTAAITGDQIINKSAGSVNFAAGASSLTVTCNKCSTDSIVLAAVATNDADAVIKNVVPGAGSFIIRLAVAAAAETRVNFWVLN